MAAKYSVICVLFTVLLTTDAKVVDSFDQCSNKDEHFYQGTPPVLDVNIPGNQLKHICQTHANDEHFATLYSTKDRIPIYSAYQVLCNGNATGRSNVWYYEPQLNDRTNGLPNIAKFPLKKPQLDRKETASRDNQAVLSDYKNTGYDRGHMNPNGYHCTEPRRTATFTLTNIVPQKPGFNQGSWHDLEDKTLESLRGYCQFDGAKQFVVTGAVPSAGDQLIHRVNVPTQTWTAACCDTTGAVNVNDRARGWSYGYYGNNNDNPSPEVVSVSELQEKLKAWYGSAGEPIIFAGHGSVEGCLFDANSAGDAMRRASDAIIKYQVPTTASPDVTTDSDRAGRGLLRRTIDYTRDTMRSGLDLGRRSFNAVRDYLRGK